MVIRAMRIRLNGIDTDVHAGAHLMEVLRTLDIANDTAGVAVAVNDNVVPRREWTSRRLENGDVVEIIHAVQGG
jgi:sulfur carrier protein